ncbi:uncharacterized protein LOC141659639 [Apium graveolens]|uniref:uncharacterized protein LOC141659639 n=1 Tax=Apium graveolens TaxID=4045 RepID=UPI003D7B0C1C
MNITVDTDHAAEVPEAGIQQVKENLDMDVEGVADDIAEDNISDQENDEILGMEFTATMTASNVNNTCHGAYIPAAIQPNGRTWISGETVTLRMGILTWNIKVVFSTGLPRFSAG